MLSERSKHVRREIFRISKANGGYHYGGSFSCVEILITLFDHVLKPEDRFILSKGHGCWGYYVLLMEKGYRPVLEGHPHFDLHNGVSWTTGSLGHGFPAGVGIALARKMMGLPGIIYILIGDGECQEGTTWESMLMAVQHKLDNLCVIVDFNAIQGSAFTRDVLSVDCLPRVASHIGWEVDEVMDGHNIEDLKIDIGPGCPGFPHMVIAHTVKGKGVSFMEGRPEWHANYPNTELFNQAIEELAPKVFV